MNSPVRSFCSALLLLLASGGCSSDVDVLVALRGDERLDEGTPVPIQLYQNEPNPFKPSTQIRYSVATTQHVRLRVFTEDWQEVAVLVDEVRVSGNHLAVFEAGDLPSGVYYCTLEGGGVTQVCAMRLV